MIIIASISIAIASCSQPAPAHADGERDLKMLPPGQPTPPQDIPPVSVPISGHCEALPQTSLRLVGMVMRQQRFGPPGYGETPKEDERITIYLLRLGRPFDVCALDVHANLSDTIHHVIAMELTGKVDPDRLTRAIGRTLTVYGTLDYQSGSHDFTEVIIRVDSIPELRTARPPRST